MMKWWQRWKVIAQKAGNFQARVLFTILYFAIVPIFALPFKLLADPLYLKSHRERTTWRERNIISEGEEPLEFARRQF